MLHMGHSTVGYLISTSLKDRLELNGASDSKLGLKRYTSYPFGSMEFLLDDQRLFDAASTELSCPLSLMWAETAPVSEVQATFDWPTYASLCETSTTLDWSQTMALSIQPINHGFFQTLSPNNTFDQAPPFSNPEERSASYGVSPSSTSSPNSSSQLSPPQTVYTHSIYQEGTQHRYILSNNFLLPDQARQRALLQHCLQSHWLNADELEPHDAPRRSILLGFLVQSAPKAAFKCDFDGCGKKFDRQDRALGHIRMHLCHRPYACHLQCGNSACIERFSCRSYLQSHLTRQREQCSDCGKAFLRQNMRRHKGTCIGSF